MKRIFVIVAIAMLAGCAVHKPVEPIEAKSPQLIYRDLTVVHMPKPDKPLVYAPAKKTVKPGVFEAAKVSSKTGALALSVPYFVDFWNESSVPVSVKKNPGLSSLIEQLDVQAQYLVIGYSHGSSSKGVKELATERALTVSGLMQQAGLPDDHLYLLASFSERGSEMLVQARKQKPLTFPALGVHVFKIDG